MDASPAADSSVLLIDDDEELCDLLAQFLGHEGFSVRAVNDGARGLEAAAAGEHCVVILDVMLPKMNGFDLLRELRRSSAVPVVMLTARGEDVDRIVGLEMGADDYLAKPFNPRELAARLRAIQRRSRHAPFSTSPESRALLVVGDVELNSRSRVVRRAGREVALTSIEFALLEILLRSAGSVVSREDLSSLGLGRRLSHSDRSIDVHVSNMRRKLGTNVDGSDRIKTVRGFGYQYTEA